jgi:chromosomal replication initiation ATPase DnaA
LDETYIPLSEVLRLFHGCCLSCQSFIISRIARHQSAPPAPRPQKTISPLLELLENVALDHGLAPDEIIAKNNAATFVNARRDFAVAAREKGYSFPQIARVLRKHHTTIIQLIKKR